jgi:hypothetical protein
VRQLRRLLAITLLVSLLLPLFGRPNVAAAASCRFVLGFQQIHEAIPDIVGDCLDNETYDRSGAVQHTTNGLMAWRKSDNNTAFTDGYRTWLIGPPGLSQRLNTERFRWEGVSSTVPKPVNPPPAPNVSPPRPASPAACDLGNSDVAFRDFTIGRDGIASAEGTVRNPCSATVNLTVDVLAREGQDGPVVMLARTIVVQDLQAGQSRTILAQVPGAPSASSFSWIVTMASYDRWCFEATAVCIDIDPLLTAPLLALTDLDEGRQLVLAAARTGVRVVRGQNEVGVLASYATLNNTITIDRALDDYSFWVRAAALAHEFQHVVDFSASEQFDAADCYYDEEQAFLRESRVWDTLWQGRLPPDIDALHADLNEVARTASSDLVTLRSAIARQYRGQCGNLP